MNEYKPLIVGISTAIFSSVAFAVAKELGVDKLVCLIILLSLNEIAISITMSWLTAWVDKHIMSGKLFIGVVAVIAIALYSWSLRRVDLFGGTDKHVAFAFCLSALLLIYIVGLIIYNTFKIVYKFFRKE